MRYKSTCGLTPAQTTELIARAWQVHQNRPPTERYDFVLPFGTAVTLVLLKARHNLPQQPGLRNVPARSPSGTA